MADPLQVWVHPTCRYMGGEYDPETGRMGLGGEWQERVRDSVREFDGDTVLVTERHEYDGRFRFDDRDATTWVTGPHVDVPYGRSGSADGAGGPTVVTDTDGGEMPPGQIEPLIQEYDAVVVRGGFFRECERAFVENLVTAADEDVAIAVDGERSYREGDRSIDPPGDDPHDRSTRERQAAEAPPRATNDGRLVDAVADTFEGVDVEVRTEREGR